ncbi:hypothetical protein PoB_005728000 [Plakobranchus ocellatus]|uniref:Uncharacterized protein n=1 Tax=Plakobranchus ocellatus TaxID=259542 RepID=A0AAV4CDD1_9GAST|nr:hypothetical protein PoB_005728000 [Plakobranchus ocellatus]
MTVYKPLPPYLLVEKFNGTVERKKISKKINVTLNSQDNDNDKTCIHTILSPSLSSSFSRRGKDRQDIVRKRSNAIIGLFQDDKTTTKALEIWA